MLLGWQHPGGTISQTSKEETDTPLEKHQLNERIPISVMPYIQSSKKRKRAQMQVENGVGHILKQMKMDIEIANGRHSPIAEKILLTCGSCQATFTPLCKSRTCQCLSLTRKTCHSCVVQLYEPLVSESSVDESLEVSTSGSISDSIADDDCRVSISEAFQIRHAPTESLFHFMPKRGKKAQWIGGSCHSHLHSQCANAKDVRSHYHFDENQERVQKFRESLLENNLGLLNLSVDKKDVEQMKLVDRLVQEVMISTAVKALVSVVFVSEKFKPNAGGVCFLTIKQD